MYSFILFIFAFISFVLSQTPEDDLVTDFPGFGKHSYDIYSGMLDVTKSGSRSIHYILVESQNKPEQAPLVIWLNGGPGCSSLLGLIQENGPFQFQGINTFLTNMEETSWNQNANVLYIEGPPGVGYSINNDKDYIYSDENTAQDFLQAFLVFRDRFSNVLNFDNPLWLSGESYAGMYVPFFTKAIIDYNKEVGGAQKINVKGFLVGNNVQIMDDPFLNAALINQYVENKFVSPELAKGFYNCFDDITDNSCQQFIDTAANVGNNTDPYQIYNYTYTYSQGNGAKSQGAQLLKKFRKQSSLLNAIYEKIQSFTGNNKNQNSGVYTPDEIISTYFNLDEVKKNLHVTQDWSECDDHIFEVYQSAPGSNPYYKEFIEYGLDILIFSGNTDAVVPWQYTDYCIQDLQENEEYGIKLTKQGKWRQWNPLPDQQIGGMVQYYITESGSQFAYAMVRAAGHEVPMYQPIAAYHMFNNFINGEPI